MDDEGGKTAELSLTLKTLNNTMNRMQAQYTKAQADVNDTFHFYQSLLEEMKGETLKELDDHYSSKMNNLQVLNDKVHDALKMSQLDPFGDRFGLYSNGEPDIHIKQLLEHRLHLLDSEMNRPLGDLEFVSNFQAIRASVRNSFGFIRSSGGGTMNGDCKKQQQPPISRPNGLTSFNSSRSNDYESLLKSSVLPSSRFPSSVTQNHMNGSNQLNSNSTLGDSANGNNNSNSRSMSVTSLTDTITSMYEKWSLGGSGSPDSGSSLFASSALLDQINSTFSDPIIDAKLMNGSSPSSILPIKSQIKRQKMIYHCKFGEFGVMEGQFTEPSGVAVNAQNDIIVADTNNHRIQIFDKEGRFKFQFGECGKRDGQLLYPNRVAVVKTSGDIIVTERAPTHQIQIYNQYGQFVRKFGANILQHPRGVTVDNKGRIIVVECKVMRVLIFDHLGNVLHKFGCSKHLEFPNGVVVNDKQEIFISDNRAHCVKVFSYEGVFLRQIGGEGLTNYPIGVCINEAGEILVADNHNNFNITIFTQDGSLISALESKVKHAQCFDVALMDDNSVVLASKDYRIYIYRYLQLQSIAQAVAASGLS
jgi:tripartite motif-containing protein 2/3